MTVKFIFLTPFVTAFEISAMQPKKRDFMMKSSHFIISTLILLDYQEARLLPEVRNIVAQPGFPKKELEMSQRDQFLIEFRDTVSIGILTTGPLHKRVLNALDTWWNYEEFRDVVTVFSDTLSTPLPNNRSIPNIMVAEGCETSYHVGLWCKNTFMWNYWRQPQFAKKKWFVRVMDDSYVHMENLLDLVKQFNHSEKIVLGDKHCYWTDHDYPSGGPGVLFSRAVLDDFNEEHWNEPYKRSKDHNNFFDDVAWGDYLSLRKIPVTNHMGIEQAPNRLNSPQWHYWIQFRNGSGRRWPLPYRPVLLHQHGTPINMKFLHETLHELAYTPVADKLIEIPGCKCPSRRHQKCIWDQNLTNQGKCQWGFDRMECIGPGPWDIPAANQSLIAKPT